MPNVATEPSDTQHTIYHPRIPPARMEAEAARQQVQTDRMHAWREGEGDPDKEEINIGSADEGCVHRCCKEM